MSDSAPPVDPPASEPTLRQRWGRHRWVRRVVWTVGSLLLLSALAWLGVPPLVRWQGQKLASQELGRAVHLGEVRFNPWTLELSVQDIEVAGAAGAPAQLGIERVYLNAAWQSIVRLAPVIDALQVQAPVLRLARRGDGHYDVDDILTRLAAAPKAPDDAAPARFALYNIELRDGRVEFDDQPVARKHELTGLQLAVPFISSLPSAREITVRPELAFVLNGSRFDSDAQALPFDASRRTDAALRLAGLDLQPYLAYLPADLSLRPRSGTVDAELRLRFEEEPRQSLRLDGVLTLSGFAAEDAAGDPALALDRLKLELAELRPLEREFHLSAIELEQPRVTLVRHPDGSLNLAPAAGSGAADAAPAPVAPDAAGVPAAQAPDAGPRLRVDAFTVHGGTVDFRDDSTAPAAAVHLEAVTLQAHAIAYPLEQPFAFSGSATLGTAAGAATQAETQAAGGTADAPQPERPTLSFEGSASLRQADLKVQVARLPLALAQPYLASYLEPRLTGELGAELGLHWAPPATPDAAPELKLTADKLALDRLALVGAQADAAAPRRGRRPTGASDTELARIERLSVSGAAIDLRARTAQVAELTLQAPWLQAERAADGRWMVERWLREARAEDAGAANAAPPEPPWTVQLDALALREGALDYADLAPSQPVRAQLTQLRLDARQLQLPGRHAMPLELSARLGTGRRSGEPGRLAWRGQLTLEPLAAQGEVVAERLPVHAFTPYFDEALNIDILRADTSYKGRVAFAETARGPRLSVAGDARVEELRTHSRPGSAISAQAGTVEAAAAAGPAAASRAALAPSTTEAPGGSLGEELLSWKQLRLTGLDVRLEPGQAPRVAIGGTRLSDFFARLVIHPNGRFNLQDVLKSDTDASAAAAPAPAPTAAAESQPAAGEANGAAPPSADAAAAAPPAARAAPAPVDPLAPVLHFGPTELVNGRIDFSDHFIRPNYSADLTELNGTLGAFASVTSPEDPQMAELRLTGRAEGSAALDISGQLNPLADPLALDIQAKMTDLDLPPLSPYSVKYAGHGIDRGKLSMDVAYKIQPDGQLTATNRLVLNQLQFGEPVAGAPASLPVQLATALLADSQGVIDLDLPISGSLNDPQFSLGPIIFKAIVNLIGKAITAPFSLLARALGGNGEDLSAVAFAPGSARLDAKARAQLDKIAKALADRPQLKLTVAGTADLGVEAAGFRRERLQALVAAELRGEDGAAAADEPRPSDATDAGAPGGNAAVAAAPGDADQAVPAAQYPELLKRLYRRADIPDKPRNVIGMQRSIPVPEMESLLMAQIPVDADAMRQLALRRGVAVKDYLAGHGVAAERLFLGAPRIDAVGNSDKPTAAQPAAVAHAPGAASTSWSPRAELSLATR
ncbi:MAG TPA: DUF748 domain-containing protein [Ottowia sp.]|uniref:DUF748 domain-containing protein n=1 Tax=Ottowia sp. TaxID=1898956 RepID=UPI002C72D1D7|nr:DUF748 domain-containing protein [Ottowia sp.]HMN22697.1 DUF748 domain-containing protein [Ottowia sp.]